MTNNQTKGMSFHRFVVWMLIIFAWNLAFYLGLLKLKSEIPPQDQSIDSGDYQ